MKTDVKKKWVEALRSKKYKQGKMFLRPKQGEFCCLGVLCDVVDEKGWKECPVTKIYTYTGPKNCIASSLIPTDLLESAGLTTQIQGKLSNMNDDGNSFSAIADYIERYL